jgi:hypothetical protein
MTGDRERYLEAGMDRISFEADRSEALFAAVEVRPPPAIAGSFRGPVGRTLCLSV